MDSKPTAYKETHFNDVQQYYFNKTITGVDQLSKVSLSILKQFDKLPLYEGLHPFSGTCKVISSKDPDDSKLFGILYQNITSRLGRANIPHILNFENSAQSPTPRLFLLFDNTPNTFPQELDFQKVLDEMKKGWISKKEGPDSIHFVKTSSITDEAVFIRCLIKKFSLTDEIHCPPSLSDEISLEVKRTAIAQVKEKLGLELTSSH